MTNSLPDEATAVLRSWYADDWNAEPLQGDASVRVYYRLSRAGGSRYMFAYYPEAVRSGVEKFLSAYEAIAAHARVPAILQQSAVAIVQEDVGDQTLFDLLFRDREPALEFYRQSIDLLVAFQKSPLQAQSLNPAFDAAKFQEELEMTYSFYVAGLMNERSDRVRDGLGAAFRELSEKIARHPFLLCHRDYHGQNLHIFKNQIYMIDYQDLRMGPDTYDLASLLRDRGVGRVLGERAENDLVRHYADSLAVDLAPLWTRYLETLLQRSIKIIGTFAKQSVARGRHHYLDFIPSTLESIRFCLDQLDGFETIAELFPMDFDAARARASV